MKLPILLVLSLFSISAFSASPRDTIARIEDSNDVQCYRVSQSPSICVGLAVNEMARKTIPCWFTLKYECTGIERFTVNLKVKESYNISKDKREQEVSTVTIFD